MTRLQDRRARTGWRWVGVLLMALVALALLGLLTGRDAWS